MVILKELQADHSALYTQKEDQLETSSLFLAHQFSAAVLGYSHVTRSMSYPDLNVVWFMAKTKA